MNKAALVQKRSLEDQAADLLRQDIVDGQLPPGTRLVEKTLAAEYGLSRGTIRIALQKLGAEGLLTQIPYAGWSVAELDETDLWELNTLRGALEGLAAKLAAERITVSGAARLREAHQRLLTFSEAGDRQAVTRGDLALHQVIIEIAGHKRLAQQYRLIENQILSAIATENQTVDPAGVGKSHDALVAAICEGNAEQAEAEAINNITALKAPVSAPRPD